MSFLQILQTGRLKHHQKHTASYGRRHHVLVGHFNRPVQYKVCPLGMHKKTQILWFSPNFIWLYPTSSNFIQLYLTWSIISTWFFCNLRTALVHSICFGRWVSFGYWYWAVFVGMDYPCRCFFFWVEAHQHPNPPSYKIVKLTLTCPHQKLEDEFPFGSLGCHFFQGANWRTV